MSTLAIGLMNGGAGMWSAGRLDGLAGTLLSPSRGAFPWMPFLVFVPLAFARTRGDLALRALWLASLEGRATVHRAATQRERLSQRPVRAQRSVLSDETQGLTLDEDDLGVRQLP